MLVSTTCSYPQDAPLPLQEESIWDGPPTGATGPYGMAKRLLHEACATYERQYGFSSAVLVLGNLFGPGDHIDPETSHVIPGMIRRYVEATRRGDARGRELGQRQRDPRVRARRRTRPGPLVLAVTADVDAAPINIGDGEEVSIREVAEAVAAATGFRGTTRWDTTKPDGTPRRYLDVSRARERLGFVAERTSEPRDPGDGPLDGVRAGS